MKRFLVALMAMFAFMQVSAQAAPMSPSKYFDKVLDSWNASMDENEKIINKFDAANTGKDFAALRSDINRALRMHRIHLDVHQKILTDKTYAKDGAQLQQLVVDYFDSSVVELEAFMELANNPPKNDNKFIDAYNVIIDNETANAEALMDQLSDAIDQYAEKHSISIR